MKERLRKNIIYWNNSHVHKYTNFRLRVIIPQKKGKKRNPAVYMFMKKWCKNNQTTGHSPNGPHRSVPVFLPQKEDFLHYY